MLLQPHYPRCAHGGDEICANGITGASTVGAIYADHLAKRRCDLLLVAHNGVQLCDGDHHVW